MTVKFEVEIEFDSARKSDIIEAARKIVRERGDEAFDDEGNKISAEEDVKELDFALMELLQTAIDNDETLSELKIEHVGMKGPNLEEVVQ